jgi:hypothetical protein
MHMTVETNRTPQPNLALGHKSRPDLALVP